jgi:uncharacterized membrane protein
VDEFLKKYLPKIAGYKGRILGTIVGFIAGLIWVFLGFWRAIAFILCVVVGFYLGKKIDQRGSLREILNKVLPPKD